MSCAAAPPAPRTHLRSPAHPLTPPHPNTSVLQFNTEMFDQLKRTTMAELENVVYHRLRAVSSAWRSESCVD
jgi:hypothetical protein|eukprot:COSAG01_NODE_3454_length_6075_cov_5.552878_3_plen_72_part_00